MSPGNPFISWSVGYKAQKRCQHGFLHSCECWFLLVYLLSHAVHVDAVIMTVYNLHAVYLLFV